LIYKQIHTATNHPVLLTKQHSNYFPHIDGLRALAVLAVLVYHLNPKWLPGGFTGVDVFFVISGFVVTASLASRGNESFARFIGGFYARRLTRVAPALIVMLTITVIATVLFVPKGWLSGFSEKTAVNAYFGLSNVLLARQQEAYFAPRTEYNPFTHTWSLGVEEQFYLLMPIILFGWFHWRAKAIERHVHWIFSALIASLAIAACIYMAWAQSNAPLAAFYSLFARFWELAAGALLFLATQHLSEPRHSTAPSQRLTTPSAHWITGSIGIALLIASYTQLNAFSFPWPNAWLPVAAAFLLIGINRNDATLAGPRKWLSHPLIVAIGLRSYSLYLWHWPVFVLMRWTVGLGSLVLQITSILLTFVFAELSYRYIETPIRNHRGSSMRPSWQRNTVWLSMIGVTAAFAFHLFPLRNTLSLSIVNRNSSDWYASERMSGMESTRRCQVELRHRYLEQTTIFEYLPSACKSESVASPSNSQLFVLGDSHATAYFMMFDQIAAETGAVVRVYSVPSCPYLDLLAPLSEARSQCVAQIRLAQRDVESLATPNDIVFLSSLRAQRLSDQWARFDEADSARQMQRVALPEQQQRIVDDAKRWLAPLEALGLQLVFELPKPIFRSPPMRCSDWFNTMNEVCSGGLSVSRAWMDAYRAPVVSSAQRLASASPRITTWDPLPILCNADTCHATENSVPRFYDGDHVSAAGNRQLYPSFRSMICERLGRGQCEK
jgi:peptidoglycan/LPS O-acetylase OafA/YrhL